MPSDAVNTSDETHRRFEILARHVFACFKSLITEPAANDYAERHDNIEAIYRKLEEKRDNGRRNRGTQGAAPDRQRGHAAPGARVRSRYGADRGPEPD